MPELDPRLAPLFAEVVALPATEREARLRLRCQDAALLAEVQALLQSHDSAGGFLETPAALCCENGSQAATPLEFDGRYRLQEQLGEGAMGTVWRAEQLTPVRREVALKVMANELQGEAARARFHAEQQAVAVFDHPHIARLYESGTTADGRPWFAMELVSGEPLFQFCESHALLLDARIELLAQVCRAVHHAHQKGVVHRDLKPSNVLVAMQDGRPAPRVIDFGVAKAVAQGPDQRQPTAHGELLGTLEYMSPEQAGATADVDTRADIYSLGVMLYQLVSGSLPFASARLRQAPLAEALRIVREGDPPALAGKRTGTRLRDLDCIAQKAMEKDRARRYASAAEFAEELERLLRDEPVQARPATAAYRLRKLLRRHRFATAAACGIAAALAAGVIGILVESGHVREQRDLALAAENLAERNLGHAVKGTGSTISFLGEIMANIAGATLARRQQAETTLQVFQELAAMPHTDGAADHGLGYAWQRMGEAQLAMGEAQAALVSFERANAVRERICAGTPGHPGVRPLGVGQWKMSEALTVLGDSAGAELHDRRALELQRQYLTHREPVRGDTVYLALGLRRIAEHEFAKGQVEAARKSYTEALAFLEQIMLPDGGTNVMQLCHAMVLMRLGDLHAGAHEHGQADALYQQAHGSLQAQSLRAGPANVNERRQLARCELTLAQLATDQGQHDQALARARVAHALARAIADVDPVLVDLHQLAAQAQLAQARAMWGLGERTGALATVKQAMLALTALSERAPDDALCRCELARACLLAADYRLAPEMTSDPTAAVEARATAAAERTRAGTMLSELQGKGRLPYAARRLLAEATAR